MSRLDGEIHKEIVGAFRDLYPHSGLGDPMNMLAQMLSDLRRFRAAPTGETGKRGEPSDALREDVSEIIRRCNDWIAHVGTLGGHLSTASMAHLRDLIEAQAVEIRRLRAPRGEVGERPASREERGSGPSGVRRAVDSAAPEFRTDEGEETREVRDALTDLARFVRQGADCLLCGRRLGETHDDMCAFGVVSMHVLLTTEPLGSMKGRTPKDPALNPRPEAGAADNMADKPDARHPDAFPTNSRPSQADEPAGPAWQPIETAPKDGTPIVVIGRLASDRDTKVRACVSQWGETPELSLVYVRGWSFISPGYMDTIEPTHWMPLPAGPSTGEAE